MNGAALMPGSRTLVSSGAAVARDRLVGLAMARDIVACAVRPSRGADAAAPPDGDRPQPHTSPVSASILRASSSSSRSPWLRATLVKRSRY